MESCILPPDLRLEPFGILLQVLMGVRLPFGKDYFSFDPTSPNLIICWWLCVKIMLQS
jgi:hypothetical protein